MDLEPLAVLQPLCRGCLTPVPLGRWAWCSTRCSRFVRRSPNDFLRVFRWCKFCGVEIDHLGLDTHYCNEECANRARIPARSVSCSVCRGDLPDPRRGRAPRFCSKRCSDAARGAVLAQPLPLRRCALPECDTEFQPRRDSDRCCSELHGKRLYNRESRADGRQKPPPWSDERRDRYHRRRAQKKATSSGEPVLLSEIAERDEWRCHLCGVDVDPEVSWPHPMSPSLDHVVPLSLGGPHAPENVRLAHLRCNSAKGNRGGEEQMLLSG